MDAHLRFPISAFLINMLLMNVIPDGLSSVAEIAGVCWVSPAPNLMTIAPISLSLLSSLTVVASICLREELKKTLISIPDFTGTWLCSLSKGVQQ